MPGGVHENMKAWEPEEDRIIIELLSELGPRWSKIVKALPGRSISSIRNRWQRIEKGRKLREDGVESKNRCNICGEPRRGHVCFEKIRQDATQRQAENDEGLADVLPDLSEMMPDAGPSAEGGGESGGEEDDGLDVSELITIARQPTGALAARAADANDDVAPPDMEISGTTPTPPPAAPQTCDAATQVEAGDLPLDDEESAADDDEAVAEASDAPTLPIVRRLKSGGRICNELGFHDAAAANDATIASPPLEAFGIIPVNESRNNSTRSIRSDSDVILPSRLPSQLNPLEPRRSFGDGM